MKKLIAIALLSLSALGATSQADACYFNYNITPCTGSYYYIYQYGLRW